MFDITFPISYTEPMLDVVQFDFITLAISGIIICR